MAASLFGADLIRHMSAPTVCHFLRSDVRDGDHVGQADEVLFGSHPELKGPDVLVEYSGDRGVTQDVLLRRLGEAGRAPSGRRSFWTSPGSADRPGSPITLSSGLHLMKYGKGTAWPPAMARGEITSSYLRERTIHPGRVEKDEKRKHDRGSARRLPESERET